MIMMQASCSACFSALASQIREIDVALRVALDHDHVHAGHVGRSGIGAMRGGRDETNIAMRLAAAAMIGADGKKPRILALRA